MFLSSLCSIPLFCGLTAYMIVALSGLCRSCNMQVSAIALQGLQSSVTPFSCFIYGSWLSCKGILKRNKHHTHKKSTNPKTHQYKRMSKNRRHLGFFTALAHIAYFLLEQILHPRMVNWDLSHERVCLVESPLLRAAMAWVRDWIYLWCCVTRKTVTHLHFHWQE